MPPEEIQQIFRDRHILVLDAPLPGEDFSLRALRELACTTIPIQMQGKIPCVQQLILLNWCRFRCICTYTRRTAKVPLQNEFTTVLRRVPKGQQWTHSQCPRFTDWHQ
jgi:hypothetical protein